MTAKAAMGAAGQHDLSLPICEQVWPSWRGAIHGDQVLQNS